MGHGAHPLLLSPPGPCWAPSPATPTSDPALGYLSWDRLGACLPLSSPFSIPWTESCISLPCLPFSCGHFPLDVYLHLLLLCSSSLSDPKTIHLVLPSGRLCPCLPGPGPALPPPVSGLPCALVPLPPQKKTGMMDTDDFRACLISMGYNMVM